MTPKISKYYAAHFKADAIADRGTPNMPSPLQRSLKHHREQGHFCAITEHWNSFAKVRQDLFGFADLLCLRPCRFSLCKANHPQGVLAIQVTTKKNMQARVNKIESLETARVWLKCGNQIQVEGWWQHGPRGERKKWEVAVREIKL